MRRPQSLLAGIMWMDPQRQDPLGNIRQGGLWGGILRVGRTLLGRLGSCGSMAQALQEYAIHQTHAHPAVQA